MPEHSFVRTGDLIGYVKAPWAHVHLAEWDGKTYLNPLRPDGLQPFSDETAPVIDPIDVDAVNGRFQATVDAYDPPPVAPPPPWQDARWTPEIVRWRLLSGRRRGRRLADGSRLPRCGCFQWSFDDVYAPGTTQNAPGRPRPLRLLALPRRRPFRWPLRIASRRMGHARGNTGTGSIRFVADG